MNPSAKVYDVLGRAFIFVGKKQGKFFALPLRFYQQVHHTPIAGVTAKVAEASLELGYSLGHWFWWNGREMFERRDRIRYTPSGGTTP